MSMYPKPLDVASLEITKANGEKSLFDPSKLLNSMTRSGIQPDEAQKIVDTISKDLYPGISTKQIYKSAYQLLKNKSRHFAARYNLKNSIMQLGPSGYPFEKFIGALMTYQGYIVQVGQIMTGKCVPHEIDVIASKGKQQILMECKYHNRPGSICDVKIPLYINSRFLDVQDQLQVNPGYTKIKHEGWVVTNTRFTNDAIKYGNCAGLQLLGWNYPVKKGLKDLIDNFGLYPITTLTSLSLHEKKYLLDKGIVLCVGLPNARHILKELHISSQRLKVILDECDKLCQRLGGS
ncbi:ATPase [Chryseotalea sanaruensis]|uniref:ATPase n=1 Tax=Chryseotalea sanaruensis TaxID=2482724 RepID=A0A401U6I0_9BACT|nr:ATP cone domain-containing protein [Chryseotalea sanaruensis]GCC50406.1 ATPase [Chryseotalea sanaruensis]